MSTRPLDANFDKQATSAGKDREIFCRKDVAKCK